MLYKNISIILPSYLSSSKLFGDLIGDLKRFGIKNYIVTVDYNINEKTPEKQNSDVRHLKAKLQEIAKIHHVKIKIFTNLLLTDTIYSPLDISAIASKKTKLFFVTLPLSDNAEVAMKNIFIIKNLGLSPIINDFDNVAVMYPKSFCKALLTTENIYFVFDSDRLDNPTINTYIKTALLSNNVVLFACTHFTSSVVYRNIDHYTRLLPKKHKMNLIGATSEFVKYIFK